MMIMKMIMMILMKNENDINEIINNNDGNDNDNVKYY